MPWTPERYPPAMRHLAPWVRDKAIAIANALLEEGLDEGLAIRIAIAKARQWAERHAAPTGSGGGLAR
ncbi:MAG: hypothetical protein KIT60_06245 [Burkholderiaceae bacterium]|nr:hypothetical protein [Burkholderiaceae bacterium]